MDPRFTFQRLRKIHFDIDGDLAAALIDAISFQKQHQRKELLVDLFDNDKDELYKYNVEYFRNTGTLAFFDHGFMPCQASSYCSYEEHLLIQSFIELLRSYPNIPDDLSKYYDIFAVQTWFRMDPEIYENYINANPRGYLAFMHYYKPGRPNPLYPSGRPRISMNQFKTAEKIEYPEDTTELIPVSRYSPGPDVGQYYKVQDDKIYHGTFYYLEPGSNVHLAVPKNRCRRYFNKLGAAIELMGQQKQVVRNSLNLFVHFYNKTFGIHDDVEKRFKLEDLEEDIVNFVTGKSHKLNLDSNYMTSEGHFMEGWYSQEDELDQPLCEAGITVGIDVMIFERVVGTSRVISEVLDIRKRKVSFQSLVWE